MDYSRLRRDMQAAGGAPDWYTTAAMQLFMEKYSHNNETVRSRFEAVAIAMAKHAPKVYPEWWDTDPYTVGKTWAQVFFDCMWDAHLSPSTPLLSNGGLRKRGTTVSCAGGYLGNNLYDRYDFMTEAAILTKHSHGTSYSIDHWPAEGDVIRGGKSKGVMPVIRDIITVMEEVAQGARRGSCSYSIRPQHGDFYKVLENLKINTESNHPGWLIDADFIRLVNECDEDALNKFADILGVKMPRGKGYFTFIDKMNLHLAEAFRRKGMTAKASNLCQETVLPADDEYTFSCVILNQNLETYHNWPKHLVQIATIMSDCNISEYLETMDEMSKQDRRALRKIYKFTKEFRALGNGVLGFHTLLQRDKLVVGSFEALMLNEEIFKRLDAESLEASKWLATVLGEPDGCVGLGYRNATRMMMPPTKSTADLMAGASEGIGLDVAMAFTKQSAGGEFFRLNKVLLEWLKERGAYTDEIVRQIIDDKGSVQNLTCLTEHEKAVMRTAFEIPMEAHLELCAQRQKYIDQGQSINLYFTSNDSEEYISYIHWLAFNNPWIFSLYYIYSMRGAGTITRIDSCDNCQ
jgi:ribonucleoside-diphosphate reductase alpha chain